MESRYCHFGVPYLDIKNYELDLEIVQLIPEELARQYKVIAIDKIGDILTVGITDLKTDIPMFTLELYKNC